MKKSQPIQQTNIVSAVALSIAIIALAFAIIAFLKAYRVDYAALDTFNRVQTLQSRYNLCHNEQIVPCDDESIRSWNKANPGNVYNEVK